MDSFWKSFSIGFLLRSVFSGYLFAFSFIIVSGCLTNVQLSNERIINIKEQFDLLPSIALMSLFIGVTINGIHRSMIYPFFEFIKDCSLADTIRYKCHISFISNNSADFMIKYWKIKNKEKTQEWGDNTHLQYLSALSLLLGALLANIFINKTTPYAGYIYCSGFVLYLSGFISDWRLKFVRDKIIIDTDVQNQKLFRDDKQDKELKKTE